ncbi:hypothetical protein FISHEDRAFT_72507 [Fistulina hepatica ATCC 64428]|uniref:TEA domain-containing protein n=1 Tax=Fistulina hepatica ATCC 64428 TaxID=1128425 RepID=A0A0D7AFG4_9AGAR|nr:hypothetical protein FISHEDRAFT_72507 [Fistulina hepatica ATCC 64428]
MAPLGLVTGRKRWKKSSGLRLYEPLPLAEGKKRRFLKERHEFIADHIFCVTGVHRTPEQIRGRLQRLRRVCPDSEIQGLLATNTDAKPDLSEHPSGSSKSLHRSSKHQEKCAPATSVVTHDFTISLPGLDADPFTNALVSCSTPSTSSHPSPPPSDSVCLPLTTSTKMVATLEIHATKLLQYAVLSDIFLIRNPSIAIAKSYIEVDLTRVVETAGPYWAFLSSSVCKDYLTLYAHSGPPSVFLSSPSVLSLQSSYVLFEHGHDACLYKKMVQLSASPIDNKIDLGPWLYKSEIPHNIWNFICSSTNYHRYTVLQTVTSNDGDGSSSSFVTLQIGAEKDTSCFWTEQISTAENRRTIDVKDMVFTDANAADLQVPSIWMDPSLASLSTSDDPTTIDADEECIGPESCCLYRDSSDHLSGLYYANDGSAPQHEGNTAFSDDATPCYNGDPDVDLQMYTNSSFAPADAMSTYTFTPY